MIRNFTILILRHMSLEKDEIGGANGVYGEERDTCRVWMEKPERKGPPRRTSSRWECNIEIGIKGM
jgi:hypothetical protein